MAEKEVNIPRTLTKPLRICSLRKNQNKIFLRNRSKSLEGCAIKKPMEKTVQEDQSIWLLWSPFYNMSVTQIAKSETVVLNATVRPITFPSQEQQAENMKECFVHTWRLKQ